jgi:hypothetical protein
VPSARPVRSRSLTQADAVVAGSAPPTEFGVETDRGITSERAAAWTFGVYVAIALPTLVWMGSYRWFFGDEWSFLTDRSVTLHDLFRAHNQHWSTVPVLVYRGLYSIFGLHQYWPYQLLVIVLHLTAAVLLRVLMRRAGVGPWIATIAAGAFVLLGPAEDNILWAFQIGFTGALVLGFTQLMLADHDGPIDRRDWFGLAAGFVCLITSGQALGLIAAAGLVCLFRRRWWAAAFHTVPLGAIYLLWFTLAEVPGVVHVNDRTFSIGEYLTWMKDAAVGLFTGLGHFGVVAVLLGVVLIVGTSTAIYVDGASNFLRRAAVPTALLVAGVISMSAAAPSRFALGEGGAKAGRYIGVMAAMTLPALAVAADALSRRWRWTTPFVAIVFLLPLPFNIVAFGDDPILSPANFRGIRNYVATLPDNPLIHDVPPWIRPNETLLGEPDMTVGWLLDADRRGELPSPTGPMNPLVAQIVPIQLGLATVDGASADGLECTDHTTALAIDPQVGDRWYLADSVQIAGRKDDKPATLWLPYSRTGVDIVLPDLHLLLAPAPGQSNFRLCR